MSRNYWKPRPKLGDIVQCSFPQEMGVPGPKNRPALVLQVEEATIEASAKTGLTKATKFDLVNHHRLSFDDAWFAPAPGKTPRYPRRGRLDLQDVIVKRKLQSAILEARNQPKSF